MILALKFFYTSNYLLVESPLHAGWDEVSRLLLDLDSYGGRPMGMFRFFLWKTQLMFCPPRLCVVLRHGSFIWIVCWRQDNVPPPFRKVYRAPLLKIHGLFL